MTHSVVKGRPKIKLEDLPKGWEEKALALAAEGASDVEIRCNAFKGMNGDKTYVMSDDLWYRLLEEEPIFSRTIKKCHIHCKDWWEAKGRKSLENKDFSYTGWYMNMKNRFGWRDKSDITSDNKAIVPQIVMYNPKEEDVS